MCCGKGSQCDGGGLTDQQVRNAVKVLAEMFGSPRARYEASDWATTIREMRVARKLVAAEFDCAVEVMRRGGSGEETLACQVD